MAAKRDPRIAHGLFTWQDGRIALEAALRSTVGVADEVLIADGLIDGVNANGLPWFSDLAWLDGQADWLPPSVPVSTRQWRSLSQACTWLLDTARDRECDWLLYVDADQELHDGELLRERLAAFTGWPCYPILRCDRGLLHPVPWQLVHVPFVRRYVSGCYVVELADGRTVSLVPPGPPDLPYHQGDPWISHHPERRPAQRYAHRLGELETVLEPPPNGIECLHIPHHLLASPGMSEGAYYCDQCGQRYSGPGVCDDGHPAAALQKLAAAKKEPAAKKATVSKSPAAKPSAAKTSTAKK